MTRPVWADGAAAEAAVHCPPLDGDTDADVCVVGLGGSGLSAVHELLDLGIRVVGVDAATIAGGAAGSNGGFLLAGSYHFYHDAVAAYGRARALEIYHLTLEQMARMVDETPVAIRRTGSLRLAASEDEVDDCRRQFAAMHQDGLPVEWYDGPEGSGLLVPTDAAFNPLQRCRLLARHAMDRGARLHEHTPAIELSAGVVATPRGTIRCAATIVAVDGGLTRLLPELAGRVRTARLQMLATSPATDVVIPRPVYWRYGMEYWQQLADGRVALGGFRDAGGDAEWTDSSQTSPMIQQHLDTHLRTVVRVSAEVTHRWAASVGFTADGLPVLEQVRPRVWAAGGYSGTGNVIGALCGRAAARLAVGGNCEYAAVLASTADANHTSTVPPVTSTAGMPRP